MIDIEDLITKQRLQAKSNFDYYWKIALLLVLVIGMIVMVGEWKDINTNSYSCTTNPFIYGAGVMANKQPNGHMECSCTVSWDSYTKPYSFNEDHENPLTNEKDLSISYFINQSINSS